MGRTKTEAPVPVTNTLLNAPLGAYVNVFKEGENYKPTGSILKRSSYQQLSLEYPPLMSEDFYVWSMNTPTTSNTRIVYGNGVFVTVDSENASTVSEVSSDGVVWKNGVLPISKMWNGLTFGNGVFVAVGSTGSSIAATSTDGITWTSRTLPVSQNWTACGTNGEGTFVALGVVIGQQTGTVGARSVDGGVTWTQITLPNAGWNRVIYANGVFVATTGYNSGSSNIAATSPDGITWTQRTLPSTEVWEDLTYGNGVFVVVSSTSTTSTTAATSPDGITWTARILPVGSAWRGVMFGNGVFLAVAGETIAATSKDGITWTQRVAAANVNHFGVAYSPDMGIFVTTAKSTARCVYYISIDGDTEFIYLTGTVGKFVRVK